MLFSPLIAWDTAHMMLNSAEQMSPVSTFSQLSRDVMAAYFLPGKPMRFFIKVSAFIFIYLFIFHFTSHFFCVSETGISLINAELMFNFNIINI